MPIRKSRGSNPATTQGRLYFSGNSSYGFVPMIVETCPGRTNASRSNSGSSARILMAGGTSLKSEST